MNKEYCDIIAGELNVNPAQVKNTVALLKDGATVPFISRYRKEATGSLDEVQIAKIRDSLKHLEELDKRRESVLESIKAQDKLTPELETEIRHAKTLTELEDLYLPYRPKKKTKATIAKAKGLEPLAQLLFSQKNINIEQESSKYIGKEVADVNEALAGARDIIAEWISEDKNARLKIRNLYEKEAVISSAVCKGKEEEGEKYKTYFDWQESLFKAPSHRILAMFRGENEKVLKVNIKVDNETAVKALKDLFIKSDNEASEQVLLAINDGYKRLLAPSIENEIRQAAKQKADEKAISIFAENLKQLLMAPPLGQKNVMAIDPGFRTGCKIVCLDKQGKLLHNETIYPHPPQNEAKQAINKIQSLISAYDIEAIAIGNGTAGRETEYLIKKIKFDRDIIAVMVNESGASVYSASSTAREEFPDYDVTVRGAVSIGRRLMDPLAELVKIEPKSIGVGQYQHDVDQKALQESLEDIVVGCVNTVGVELNTASRQLLSYVSGIGGTLADNIVKYRDKNGSFKSRKELKKVTRFGEKVFEQSAGFIRIRNAANPLDNTAVHPESYGIVEKMAKDVNCTISELIKDENLRKKINISSYVNEKVGLPTLMDITDELSKPGRDPRKEIEMFTFDRTINKISDLVIGKRYPGIVTNITAFGAFVDIGVHQDGLVHISELADEFVKDPNDVVKLNDKVIIKVIAVDAERKRISLSMKQGKND